LLAAIGSELALLTAFVGVPPVAEFLGGGWPAPTGWVLAALAIPVLLAADTVAKLRRRGAPGRTGASSGR